MSSMHLVRRGFSGGRHFQGGAGPSVQCEVCKRTLLLVWDLDGADPIVRSLLGEHVRVPILYCWRCAGEVAYRVRPDGIERVFTTGRYQGDDFPYRGYPDAFPRTELGFEPVPEDIASELARRPDSDELDEPMEDRLPEGWLNRVRDSSHLGESLFLWQDYLGSACPVCRDSGFREVAAIVDDGLPMLSPECGSLHAQVVVSSCPGCGLVHVMNQAD